MLWLKVQQVERAGLPPASLPAGRLVLSQPTVMTAPLGTQQGQHGAASDLGVGGISGWVGCFITRCDYK